MDPVAFGGPTAPYPEDHPDVLRRANRRVSLMKYGTGGAAAVGVAGKAALSGFPLEVVDGSTRLPALLAALLGFLG